MKRHALIFAGQ